MKDYMVVFLVLLALVRLGFAKKNPSGQESLFEAHPTDCSAYYELQLRQCPQGSLFNNEEQRCDLPENVNCDCRGEGNTCERSPAEDRNGDQHEQERDDHGNDGDKSNKDVNVYRYDDNDGDSEENHENDSKENSHKDDENSQEGHRKYRGHHGSKEGSDEDDSHKGHGKHEGHHISEEDGDEDDDDSHGRHGKHKEHHGSKEDGDENDDDDNHEGHGKHKGHHGSEDDSDEDRHKGHEKHKEHRGSNEDGDNDDDDDDDSHEGRGKHERHHSSEEDGDEDDDDSHKGHGKHKEHRGSKEGGDDNDDDDDSYKGHGKHKEHRGSKEDGDDGDDDSHEGHGKLKGHHGSDEDDGSRKGHGKHEGHHSSGEDGDEDDDDSHEGHEKHGGHHSSEKGSSEDRGNSVCKKLESSQHGKWIPRQCSKKSQKLGRVCKLECSQGFERSGGSQVRCMESGWEGEYGANIIPTCMSGGTTSGDNEQSTESPTTTTVEEIGDEFMNILNNTDGGFEQVLFIVDSSRNVGETTFYRTELNFVKVITEVLFSRISFFGLTTYNDVADVVIPLDEYQSSGFIQRVDNVRYSPRSGSDLANVLDRCFSDIQRSGRRTLVVLISGTESSTDGLGEARLIQTRGNIIIPVVVEEVNRNTAMSISSVNEEGSSLYFVFQSWEIFSLTTTYISQNYESGSTHATQPSDETSDYESGSTDTTQPPDVTPGYRITDDTTQTPGDEYETTNYESGTTDTTQSQEETSGYRTTDDTTLTHGDDYETTYYESGSTDTTQQPDETSGYRTTDDTNQTPGDEYETTNYESGSTDTTQPPDETSAYRTTDDTTQIPGDEYETINYESGSTDTTQPPDETSDYGSGTTHAKHPTDETSYYRTTDVTTQTSEGEYEAKRIEEVGEEVVSVVNGTFTGFQQVLFIVDSSRNIGESTFYNMELNFVKVITEVVFSRISYFGLITYNDYAEDVIPLTEIGSAEFIQRVDSVQYSPRDGSDIANALDRAFSNIRHSGRRTLVVFISGTESSVDGSGEARLIKSHDNFIIPVLVGEVNRNTAISISSVNEEGSSVYFLFQNWKIFNAITIYIRQTYISESTEEVLVCEALQNSQRGHWETSNCSRGTSELGTVCELVCEEGYELSGTPEVICNQSGWVRYGGDRNMPSCKTVEEIGEDFIANINKTLWRPANLMFVVDGSGSLTEEEFGLETGLVNAIVRAFPLSEDRSAGVVTFSSDATVDVPVNSDDTCTFLSDVNAIRYPRGGTNLALALQLANSELEQNAVHDFTVTFLITDGVSTTDPTESAAVLKRGDHPLFAIGVGDYDAEQLTSIATYFYPIRDFGIFNSLKNVLETDYASRTNVQC